MSVMLSEIGEAEVQTAVSLHEIWRSLVREAMGIVVCTALNSSGTSKLKKAAHAPKLVYRHTSTQPQLRRPHAYAVAQTPQTEGYVSERKPHAVAGGPRLGGLALSKARR